MPASFISCSSCNQLLQVSALTQHACSYSSSSWMPIVAHRPQSGWHGGHLRPSRYVLSFLPNIWELTFLLGSGPWLMWPFSPVLWSDVLSLLWSDLSFIRTLVPMFRAQSIHPGWWISWSNYIPKSLCWVKFISSLVELVSSGTIDQLTMLVGIYLHLSLQSPLKPVSIHGCQPLRYSLVCLPSTQTACSSAA
jgi:hypothetical protein